MKPLSFSTNAFKKNTLAEAIDAIAEIGYGGVELMADLHHANPATFDAAARAATKKQLAAKGLTVSNVNAFTYFCDGDTYHPTWIENDELLRDKRIRHTIGCVELAAEFGAKTIRPTAGRAPHWHNAHFTRRRKRAICRWVESRASCARQHNIILAIEFPEPGLFIQTRTGVSRFSRAAFQE